MTPAVLVAAIISAGVALPFSFPLHASWQDIGILTGMGTIQAGLGCLLMTLASQHITAAEVGLFALLETILGPLWVWIGVGEQPSNLAIVGGIIVVASLAINELVGLRGQRKTAETLTRLPSSQSADQSA
jgi:drug/metabolite transporter (DMT)-like permease